GLLDTTLVIWMGEFGRTPHINQRGAKPGRDHYPRAWTSVLAGGGIKGGQVVGKTDKEGAAVVERQTSALDFMATVCQILRINHTKQTTADGRPTRIVDKGSNPIKELLKEPHRGRARRRASVLPLARRSPCLRKKSVLTYQ